MPKKICFNSNWEFCKFPLETTLEQVLKTSCTFTPVEIPHDWLIWDASNLYEDSMGWYKKSFFYEMVPGESVSLFFEGIYMDATLYLNNHKVDEWKNGYASFEAHLTPYLQPGINHLFVSVNHQSPNSRWYTGAGIYRDVWMNFFPSSYICTNGIYIHTSWLNDTWLLEVDTELVTKKKLVLRQCVFEKHSGKLIKATDYDYIPNPGCFPTSDSIHQVIYLEDILPWDIESPHLYVLETSLFCDHTCIDQVLTTFGFRTIAFDPQNGFLLNNRQVKLKGVCEHHDLGCLGSAYHRAAMSRKFKLLKEMGVNAIRTAHNMPAPDVLDLADEFGILINLESYDTWELPKTTYDYSRFFKDHYQKDIASWVKRDRNHPSLIMWCIGNEIYDIHASQDGTKITTALMNEVKKYDPLGNAAITMGSNYLPWENARKSGDILKLVGYNYGEKYYHAHHTHYNDWIIYGSETGSVVQSRGVYHFPFNKSVLTDADYQCSALGNSTTSWGAKSPEACIIFERDCSFSCGQFIWSGFDYIGEPTPYHTKNAYFGQLDTAGFPKDSYFIYQAEWTSYKTAPMIHIFPYWDFNIGQLIDVRICSNAPLIELRKDDIHIGFFEIDHQKGNTLVAHFQIPYTKGTLQAFAYDENKQLIATSTSPSFEDAAQVHLAVDKTQLLSGGRDLAFLEITMKDQYGHTVENANNRVTVSVSGVGRLIGLDNGDSTDYESYKGTSKRLFNGKLLAIIGSTYEPGEIYIQVTSPQLHNAYMRLESIRHTSVATEVSHLAENIPSVVLYGNESTDIPIRKIELASKQPTKLTPECTQALIEASLLPENCSYTYDDLEWSVVDDAGIVSHIATLTAQHNQATVTAIGDGTFHVRCMTKNGKPHISLISQLDFHVSGLGEAYLNPYDFISGGLYTYSMGTVSNGNEHGIATSRDGETQVGYHLLDFGKYGSDEITIPIFALSSEPYSIEIWEGMPTEASHTKLGDFIYHKNSIWNTYQSITYKLSKPLVGLTSLCFVTQNKMHIKGFSFTKPTVLSRTIYASIHDSIYGDQFEVAGDWVKSIGNNVTLTFKNLDFTPEGATHLMLCGQSTLQKNTIHLVSDDGVHEKKQLLELTYQKGVSTWEYTIDKLTDQQTISFIFLPGSQFDFHWFCFK